MLHVSIGNNPNHLACKLGNMVSAAHDEVEVHYNS